MTKIQQHILLLFTLLICGSGFSQYPGYLGKKVLLSINSSIQPSFLKTYGKIKNDEFNPLPKLIYASFSGSIETIISRKLTLSATYTFDPLLLPVAGRKIYLAGNKVVYAKNDDGSLNGFLPHYLYILNDIYTFRHDFGAEVKIYLKNNLPPIGKYISAGISYSMITSNRENPIYTNWYSKKQAYTEKGNAIMLKEDPGISHGIYLKAGIGESLEITKNLFFFYSLNLNLPVYASTDGFISFFTIGSLFGRSNEREYYAVDQDIDQDIYIPNDLRGQAMTRQNLIMLQLGFTLALF